MDKKYKITVAGCGTISHQWFTYIKTRKDSEIVSLVDINRANAEKIKSQYELKCPVYNNLTSALRDTTPNLVFDLTYVTTHADIVTEALEAECNVFGEKPMALTQSQAKQMIKKAREKGKVYNVLQHRRYVKGFRALKEIITSGVIGKPGFVCADIFTEGDLSSIRNQLEKPMLMDNAVHTFDQARFLLDADPVSVYCESFNPPGSIYKGDAAGICIFEMNNGSVFDYRCQLGIKGCLTTWESTWRVMGSKGTAIWNGGGDAYYEIPDDSGGAETKSYPYRKIIMKPAYTGLENHAGAIHEMFDALENGRKAETNCEDNYKSIQMVFTAEKSAESGKKIVIK